MVTSTVVAAVVFIPIVALYSLFFWRRRTVRGRRRSRVQVVSVVAKYENGETHELPPENFKGLETLLTEAMDSLAKDMESPWWWAKQLFLFAFQMLIPTHKIAKPPGSRLMWLADFVYSQKDVSRVFKPVIDDMQFEYIEALAAGRVWKARWVCIRGRSAFWTTVVVHASTSAVLKVFGAFKMMGGM